MSQKKLVTPPPITTDEQLSRLIALTYQQVETELLEKRASSQTKAHFLSIATRKAELELKKLEMEILLAEERIRGEQSVAKQEEYMREVLDSIRSYSGADYDEEDYYD